MRRKLDTYEEFICIDCGENTLHTNEYYMVHDEVWNAAHPTRRGMLCIGCLEDRLGRQLVPEDFPDLPINRGYFLLSARALSRITGIPTAELPAPPAEAFN